jgi:O-antigen ligase
MLLDTSIGAFRMKTMLKQKLLAALRWLTYGAVVLVPLVFFRYSMFPFGIPKIALFQGIVEFMAAAWIALVILDRRYLPRRSWNLWAILAFAAVLVLSGLLGADIFRSFWSTIDRTIGIVGILHFLVFAIILLGLGEEIDWTKVWLASSFTAGIVALSVVLSKWGLRGFFLNQSYPRPGGLYGNALFVGQYLLFHVFIIGWLLLGRPGKRNSAILATSLALSIFAIILTQTIGIILSLAAGAAILLLGAAISERGRMRKVAGALLVAGVILAAIIFGTRTASVWQKIPGLGRVASISSGQSDVKDRLIAWKTALTGFKERPLLGWGWENAHIPFNKHYDPKLLVTSIEGTFFDKPHNVFLEHLVTGGVLGLLAYLGLFAAMGISLKALWRRGDKRGAYFFGAALFSYLLQNAIAFDTIATYPMLALILAWSAGPQTIPAASPERPEPRYAKGMIVAAGAVAVALVWIYNAGLVRMANHYYWGINYFLNALPESSDLAFHQALAIRNPYRDYVNKDFASIVSQGFQQGIEMPHFDERVKEGAADMEAITKHHPQDYFFQVAAADYYVTLSAFNKAEYLKLADAHLAIAKELSPSRQQIYYVLARRYLMENKRAEALQAFRDAIALNPNSGEPHFTYGMLLYGLGNAAEGRKEIARAAELGRTPSTVDEAVRLASFEADIDHDYAGAVTNLKIALALIGTDLKQSSRILDVRFKLGVAYYLLGDKEHAREELQFIADNVDVKKLSNWEALQPALDEVGVKYAK